MKPRLAKRFSDLLRHRVQLQAFTMRCRLRTNCSPHSASGKCFLSYFRGGKWNIAENLNSILATPERAVVIRQILMEEKAKNNQAELCSPLGENVWAELE